MRFGASCPRHTARNRHRAGASPTLRDRVPVFDCREDTYHVAYSSPDPSIGRSIARGRRPAHPELEARRRDPAVERRDRNPKALGHVQGRHPALQQLAGGSHFPASSAACGHRRAPAAARRRDRPWFARPRAPTPSGPVTPRRGRRTGTRRLSCRCRRSGCGTGSPGPAGRTRPRPVPSPSAPAGSRSRLQARRLTGRATLRPLAPGGPHSRPTPFR